MWYIIFLLRPQPPPITPREVGAQDGLVVLDVDLTAAVQLAQCEVGGC